MQRHLNSIFVSVSLSAVNLKFKKDLFQHLKPEEIDKELKYYYRQQ